MKRLYDIHLSLYDNCKKNEQFTIIVKVNPDAEKQLNRIYRETVLIYL